MNSDCFRLASPADIEKIVALVNAAYRPQPGAAGWTHEAELIEGQRTTPAQVAKMLARPHSIMLLALKQHEIVGCIHLEKDTDNMTHLGMFAINPHQQTQGLGKQLLVFAEHYAHKHFATEKFSMIVLSARTELIAFYLRRGYHRTHMKMNYPKSAGVGTPKVADLTLERLEKHV